MTITLTLMMLLVWIRYPERISFLTRSARCRLLVHPPHDCRLLVHHPRNLVVVYDAVDSPTRLACVISKLMLRDLLIRFLLSACRFQVYLGLILGH
jgi:hypothetical protein